MNLINYDLCLVTHINEQPLAHYLQFIELAIQGGVTLIQLRDKLNSPAEIRKTALALQRLLAYVRIPLIINDYVDLALEIDAAGVHLGTADLPPHEARRILGQDKIIGYSVDSYVAFEQINTTDCVDYLGVSAVFPSQTKTDCKTIWGLEGLHDLSQQTKHPLIAIGGINATNVSAVMQHGAQGVAVVSAIHHHPNPLLAAQELRRNIQDSRQGTSHVR